MNPCISLKYNSYCKLELIVKIFNLKLSRKYIYIFFSKTNIWLGTMQRCSFLHSTSAKCFLCATKNFNTKIFKVFMAFYYIKKKNKVIISIFSCKECSLAYTSERFLFSLGWLLIDIQLKYTACKESMQSKVVRYMRGMRFLWA